MVDLFDCPHRLPSLGILFSHALNYGSVRALCTDQERPHRQPQANERCSIAASLVLGTESKNFSAFLGPGGRVCSASDYCATDFDLPQPSLDGRPATIEGDLARRLLQLKTQAAVVDPSSSGRSSPLVVHEGSVLLLLALFLACLLRPSSPLRCPLPPRSRRVDFEASPHPLQAP